MISLWFIHLIFSNTDWLVSSIVKNIVFIFGLVMYLSFCGHEPGLPYSEKWNNIGLLILIHIITCCLFYSTDY